MKINNWTKTIGVLLLSLGLFKPASGFAQTLSIQSGSSIDVAQPAQPDSLVQIAAESQGLAQIAPEDLPIIGGTFWWVMPGGNAVPAPCLPLDLSGAIYQIADGQFLVDETGGQVVVNTHRFGLQAQATSSTVASEVASQADAVVNLITQIQATAANQQLQAMAGNMMAMDVPSPGDGGDGGTNSFTPDYSSYTVNYGSNLWVAGISVLSGNLNGTATNTQSGIQYDIQSRTNLLQTDWQYEGTILGSAATNWTPLSVSQNGRQSLFLRLRSNASDGSGLPDWWQLEYFGTTGINPNAQDPAGDGWSNWQKFQMGLNPNVFYTPPAPQGVTVTYNASTGAANVSWQHSPGSVTGYTVNFNGTDYSVSASATNLTETLSTAYSDPVENGPALFASFQVQADYAIENSAWSASVRLEAPDSEYSGILNVIPVYMFEGSQGSNYLAASVSMLPPGTVALRLTRADWYAEYWYDDLSNDTHWDIPVSTFTNNGLYQLPTSMTASPADAYGASLYRWWVQAVYANKPPSAAQLVSWGSGYGEDSRNWAMPPYFDGRAQLKQNLIFALRAATMDYPFSFNYGSYYSFAEPSSYAVADFNQSFYSTSGSMGFYGDVYWPFAENCLLRNFVFGLTNVDGGGALATGASGDYYDSTLNLQDPLTFQFQVPANSGGSISPILGTNQTQWLAAWATFYTSDNALGELGVTQSYDADWNLYFSLAGNARNVYGLPFSSVKIAWGNTAGATYTLSAGNQVENVDGHFYPQTAQPQLQTVEYDFWQQYVDTLPGQSGFSKTNQSRLLITGVGQGFAPNVGEAYFTIAGYAKLAVQNGYSGVYGYLQQYFDKAYQIDTNGIVTTNTTGILSPYGDFFATQPGPAALVTMPDVDTGARGTGVVQVISLVLNKSHNGGMDLSFNGPDATSASSPYLTWANNNYDRWTLDADDNTNYMDDVLVQGCPLTPNTATPDCNYRDMYGNRVIPCTRDLEDYARLWVCGITSNLLAALPAGSTITLNWGDVGNPNSGNPTIDLFQATDPDGGIEYLTNETSAATQINPVYSAYVGRVGPGQSIQLNSSYFSGWAGNHFIWCGVSNGTGGLNLTITDGNGNTLAQTTAYIQIVDIKQMYERWTVGDNPTNTPSNTAIPVTDGLPAGVSAFEYAPPTDTNTPYILFVHGWNLLYWEKDRFAETAFKRLYWQGYQGRFGEFRWPTSYGFTGTFDQLATDQQEKDNFDNSEGFAWLAGTGLLNKLNDLNAQYPGQVYMLAHSMGNVVAGEALRLAGSSQVVKTYVASQAAVSAHTYDPTVSNYSFSRSIPVFGIMINFNLGPNTPNIYGNWFAGNYGGGAGKVVSFYNVNDYALSPSSWQLDQLFKPDILVAESGALWNYGYSGSPSDPSPWNHFYKTNNVSTTVNFDIIGSLPNRYEVMSHAAQSYTTALGATPGVHQVAANVDLTTLWPPDPTGNDYIEHFWHSAEFRGDYAPMQGYWSELLGVGVFNLK